MMQAGVQLTENDIKHLRELVSATEPRPGSYTFPVCNYGFCGTGKTQYLAALDHYKPGTPRDFVCPCCDACGKISDDIGKALLHCGECKRVWYCDKDCQKSLRDARKHLCAGPLEENGVDKSNV